MREVLAVGNQPVPGYELVESLGGSAFYRMWKARGPDGKIRLWKEIDLVVGNAAIETRTLGLLVQLKHQNLNTLTNFWQLDDGKTLIIETEVPTMSLRDRFEECQQAGKPMPVDELQQYMVEAAAGLDFLNSPSHEWEGDRVAIYHRALRPECLLVFPDESGAGRVCKISDFGLSKPVSEEVAEHSQGLTNYDYDPPEFFEGHTAPTSDQYALAINYYELRTGTLPFSGLSMLAQLQARLNDNPDLQLLEEPERGIVRKALAREPKSRYENCSAFAKQLKDNATLASSGTGAPMPAAASPAGGFVAPTAPQLAGPPSAYGTPTSGGIAPTPTSPAGASPGPAPGRLPPFGTTPSGAAPVPPSPAEPPGVVFHRPPPPQSPPPAAPPMGDGGLAGARMGTSPEEPAPQPVLKRPVPATDLRTIRKQLGGGGGVGLGSDDDAAGSGETRIPILWVAMILLATVGVVVYLTMFMDF